MAAIGDKDNTLDLTRLANGLRKELPPYARPLFVRAVRDVEMTGTKFFSNFVIPLDGGCSKMNLVRLTLSKGC